MFRVCSFSLSFFLSLSFSLFLFLSLFLTHAKLSSSLPSSLLFCCECVCSFTLPFDTKSFFASHSSFFSSFLFLFLPFQWNPFSFVIFFPFSLSPSAIVLFIPFFFFLTFNMFLHVEHHLFPQIPTAHLPLLARRLDAALPDARWSLVW